MVRLAGGPGGSTLPLEMLNCHDLIANHGLENARKIAADKGQRAAVEAAAAILADSAHDFVYAGMAGCALPHKNVDASPQPWRYAHGDLNYVIRSGVLNGHLPVGVPYGSKARLILLYLQDAAIRAGSRTIELGSCMYGWTRAAHPKSLGGMTYRLIIDQSMRAAGCRVTIDGRDAAFLDAIVQPEPENLVREALPRYLRDRDEVAMPDFAVLNETFYDSFRQSAVPVRRSALRQLSNNSVAIDLYIWLCHTLPTLSGARLIVWAELAERFGAGYQDVRHLRRPFLRAVELVLAVYPEAKVEKVDRGLLCWASRPAVKAAGSAMCH